MRPPPKKLTNPQRWIYAAIIAAAISAVLTMFMPTPKDLAQTPGPETVTFRASCGEGKCAPGSPMKFEYTSLVPGYGAVFEVDGGKWVPLTNDTGALPVARVPTLLSAQAASADHAVAWVLVYSGVPIDNADVLLHATAKPEELAKRPGVQERVV